MTDEVKPPKLTERERIIKRDREARAKQIAALLTDDLEVIAAEQALLGNLLYESDVIHRLGVNLQGADFFEPFHGRLFESIHDSVGAGFKPDPVLMQGEFRLDPAFADLGGARYLANLVDNAPPAVNAPSYARQIVACAARRQLICIGIDMAVGAASDMREEPTEILAGAERQLMEARARDRRDDLSPLRDAVASTVRYVEDRSRPVGVVTGLTALDRSLGPIAPKDYIILGGATGMGKSAVGTSIGMNVAAPDLAAEVNDRDHDPTRKRKGVMIIGAEMTFGTAQESGQVERRIISDLGFHMFGAAFPTYSAIKAKGVSHDQLRMMRAVEARLADVPLVGIKRSGLTMPRIRGIALKQFDAWARAGVEPGLIIIDHLGLIKSTNSRQSRYEAQSEVADAGKDLADDLQIAVLAMVQVSRAVSKSDDKRPTVNDLKDSGSIENAADMVVLCYRDAYYAQREREPDAINKAVEWGIWNDRCNSKELELIIGKVRESFGVGSVKLWADMGFNAVRERAPERRHGLLDGID